MTRNSTVPQILSVGTDGQVLVADSTQPNGLKWSSSSRTALALTIGPGSPHLLLNTEEVIQPDTTASPVTINLSLGTTYTVGRVFGVKDMNGNAATNNITINTSGGQLLDGLTSFVMNINYASIQFYWDGVEWNTI